MEARQMGVSPKHLVIRKATIAALALMVAACSSAGSSSRIRDPGPGRRADIHGTATVLEEQNTLSIDGRTVQLGGGPVQGNCLELERCYAFVFLDSDGTTAARVFWWSPMNLGDRLYSFSTSAFRFDASVLVLQGGLSVPLSDAFTVDDGCNDGDTREALLDTQYGATFVLDGDSGEVVSGGCNGNY